MVLRIRYLLAKGHFFRSKVHILMNLNFFVQLTTSLQIWYMQKLDHARDKYSHCVLLLSSSIINTWPIETKSAIMVPPTGVKANEILVGWELRTWWDFHRSKTQKKTELFSQGLFLSVISSYAAWVCAKAIWILWLRSFAKIYISRRRVYFFESKPPWANFWFKSVMESSEIINAHIHIGDE